DPGPLRTGYGPTRDYVIGMEAVLADGTLVHSGGRVVKNVAGFDLNKLFIGSYGTLGIVTRLFVKLRPEPEFETTLRMSCRSNSEVIDLARQIMQLEVLPAALEISAAAEGTRVIPASDSSFMPGSGGYLLSVRLIDSLAAIGEQADRILATARSSNARFDRMDGEESALFWRRWNEMLAGSAGSLRLRISTLPSRSSQLFRWGEEQLLRIAKQAVLTLAPATGTIRAVTHPPIDGEEEARIAGLVSTWRAEAEALAGYLTVESAAVGVKALVDSWGEVGLQFELMKRIKSKFDPRATFSPGRFLGGL
ncbi:MAG: FAD-binding oxidoreductase, partial [Acidobacteria bacterium]|nr:FAD-binding oxidoreductase [Acidobacteriota bacterium]